MCPPKASPSVKVLEGGTGARPARLRGATLPLLRLVPGGGLPGHTCHELGGTFPESSRWTPPAPLLSAGSGQGGDSEPQRQSCSVGVPVELGTGWIPQRKAFLPGDLLRGWSRSPRPFRSPGSTCGPQGEWVLAQALGRPPTSVSLWGRSPGPGSASLASPRPRACSALRTHSASICPGVNAATSPGGRNK